MKTVSSWILSFLCFLLSSTAFADFWAQGNITEIQIMAAGNTNDKIVVWGTFATGCTFNAFELIPTDSLFKQSYAAFLTAKATSVPIKVLICCCDPTNGFARANGYSVISN
jgi:hypothetical protein